MQKAWVHPNLKIQNGGYQSFDRLSRPAAIPVRPYALYSDFAATLSLIVVIPILLIFLAHLLGSNVPLLRSAYDLENLDISRLYSESANRNAFVSNLALQHRREVAGQVHFLSELIKTHNRRLAPNANDLAFTIVSESRKANIDPFFVAAVIKAESTFRTEAVSPVGALGLMQIMPATGKYISKKANLGWQGVRALYSPRYNIELGIAYLQYLDRRFKGNKENMLIAYNWGPGNLSQALRGQRKVPGSPRSYARQIIADHQSWGKTFQQRAHEFSYLKLASR